MVAEAGGEPSGNDGSVTFLDDDDKAFRVR